MAMDEKLIRDEIDELVKVQVRLAGYNTTEVLEKTCEAHNHISRAILALKQLETELIQAKYRAMREAKQ